MLQIRLVRFKYVLIIINIKEVIKMKKKKLGIFICILLILTSIIPLAGSVYIEPLNTYSVRNEKIGLEYTNFIPGEIIVKIKKDVKLSLKNINNIMTTGKPSIDRLNRIYKVRDIEATILSVNKKPKNPDLFEYYGLDQIFTFKCDHATNILDAIEAYKKDPNIEFVEPNYVGHGCIIPNDPSFNNQWNLHNTGQSGGTPDADIDGPEAWNIKLGSSNVVIAIVDTGIDYNHEDLDLHIWQNTGEIAGNGIDDDGNGFIDDIRGWNFYHNNNNPMDFADHGTHCAGIAGARTNNNKGIAGVMWTVKLMAVKVAHCSGWGCFNATDSANGIIYAADNRADVISMSWSFTKDINVIKNACNYAYAIGCFMCAAIGNHGSSSKRWPAAYTTVMAVGATDYNDDRCSWSAHGNHINVVAPGGRTTTSSGVDIYSTIPNDKYGYMWGTSMSTPHVAGLAGLLKAQDSSRSNSDIWTIIVNTADDLGSPGWDEYYGMGRINAYTALYGAPYKPIIDGPINGKAGIEYNYTGLTWDPNGDNIHYWFDWDDGSNSGWVGPFNSGQTGIASHVWNTQGTYHIKVKAKDTSGKESNWSDSLEVTMPMDKASKFSLLNWQIGRLLNAFPILKLLIAYKFSF